LQKRLDGDIRMNASSFGVSGMKASSMAGATSAVVVVDDDISVRESLELLITEAGWRAELFASAEEFLARPRPVGASCLILDVNLPELSGLELQKRIAADHSAMPIIFITGHGNIPMTVQAMKAGAVEFLTKPYTSEVLLGAVRSALERSRAFLAEQAGLELLRERHRALTPREKQVMALVVRGQLNKQTGGALGISEITVKAHRGRVMRKMHAKSLAELVKIATRLGLETAGKG
jgi:FixJ family two-component response regulator